MRIVVSDIETEGLSNCKKLWICGGKDLTTGEVTRFDNCHEDPVAKAAAIEWYKEADLIVGHNFLSFDAVQLNSLLKPRLIDPKKIVDTLLISRLIDYDISIPKGAKNRHSLQAWGTRLGDYKGDHNDWTQWSTDMVEYWYQDIEVSQALYKHFSSVIWNPDWRKSLRAEHDLQIELVRAKHYGFQFDSNKAEFLLNAVQVQLKQLEEQFRVDFPPKMTLVNTIKYRVKQDGEEMASVKKAKEKYDLTQKDGDDLLCFNWIDFNPGSTKDRIDALWEAGWKPLDKTKTAYNFERMSVGDPYGKNKKPITKEMYKEKSDNFKRYGWTVSEDNLSTLPDDTPEGPKTLARWLTLEGRRSSLVEWLGQVGSDGRIHGTINNIGAWTGRCSHNNPNTANIPSVFHGEPKTAVEEVKKQYDSHLRACWTTPSGSYLVGTDADGIQLRVLADYLWRYFDADQYARAIMEGRKENETDIHNVNKHALGLNHATRDMAKTFIYAWLLGAGVAKTAQILKVNQRQATEARDNFVKSIDGLAKLKNKLIPAVSEQGYFTGYDGRKVKVPSAHKALAGMLQNAESILMKYTLLRWTDEARKLGINFKLVGFIHDEYQTEVIGTKEEAEALGKLQADCMLEVGQELGFKIPTPGSFDVGKNWLDTH
jgi:hypothetical protein